MSNPDNTAKLYNVDEKKTLFHFPVIETFYMLDSNEGLSRYSPSEEELKNLEEGNWDSFEEGQAANAIGKDTEVPVEERKLFYALVMEKLEDWD